MDLFKYYDQRTRIYLDMIIGKASSSVCAGSSPYSSDATVFELDKQQLQDSLQKGAEAWNKTHLDYAFIVELYKASGAGGILTTPQTTYASRVFPHSHDFYEFLYVAKGSCISTVDGKTFEMGTYDLCLMNTNAIHSLEMPHAPNDYLLNIIVRKDVFDETFLMLAKQGNTVAEFFLSSLQSRKLQQNYLHFRHEEAHIPYRYLVEQFFSEDIHEDPYRDQILKILLRALLLNLVRNDAYRMTVESSKDFEQLDIAQLITFIADNCASISLQSIADRFGYSPYHFSKLVKKYAGKTFSELLQDIRFNRVTELLTNTNMPVTEIATTVGFGNLSWFYRKFKARYNALPLEYRKLNTSIEND